MRRDKDGRDPAVLRVQSGLQLETRHSRHANVSDKACRVMLLARIEELLGRGKRLHGQASRFHQPLQSTPDRLIIINNRNYLRLRLSNHISKLRQAAETRNYPLV